MVTSSSNRNAKFPDVPTAAELNLPRADGMTLWMGLAAHKDVPDTVAAAWAEALPKVFADPEYKGLLSRRGADLVGTLPDQTNAFVAAQVANMVQLKAAIGY